MRTLSLCTCCRHYPGAAAGRTLRSSRPAVSAFPERVVGSACTSTFSRFARRSLALRPAHSRGHQFVARYTEGFSHFVTSMTAPVASGGSESPGGSHTHWKAPPFTVHTQPSRPRGSCGTANSDPNRPLKSDSLRRRAPVWPPCGFCRYPLGDARRLHGAPCPVCSAPTSADVSLLCLVGFGSSKPPRGSQCSC